ncbi:MAG TPA: NPCBM/NEW2 domain-containing protein [Polyangia bacterium]|jgi:alpha-galactosidase|nr:NPCBM/NEW2 domain-containing protein [Polyangia bacterium]
MRLPRSKTKTIASIGSLALLLATGALAGCGGGGSSTPGDVDDDFPQALAAGLAPTPPMGWNSWNEFQGNVSEKLIKSVADALMANGLKDAGYTYVNIDDTWSNKAGRASDGSLQPDLNKFPDGISGVADYVHAAGLKLGIYGDRGTATCGGYPGSQGYEMQDASTFASWGVDYLKYDNCNASLNVETQYQTMQTALAATARPFVFSLCAWQFYEWGVTTGNLWRTTSDISDGWPSIYANLLNNRTYAAYAGPNGWNDPDMLEVGVSDDLFTESVSHTEYQSHFSLWAISAAPLILGDDPTQLPDNPDILSILTNKEVIALDQDPLGLQGTQVWQSSDGTLSVWAKPLNAEGARGVVLLNAGADPADVSFTLPQIGLAGGSAKLRDLVAHADLGTFDDSYTVAAIPSHGTATLLVTGSEPPSPSGTQDLSDLTWTYQANGLGPVERDMSNGFSEAGDGTPISLFGTPYAKGLGMAAPAAVIYRLNKKCTSFSATVGIDDSTNGQGSVVFQVWAQGGKDDAWTNLFTSLTLTGLNGSGPMAVPFQVDLTGMRRLKLLVTNAGDGAAWDRASWGNPQIVCASAK